MLWEELSRQFKVASQSEIWQRHWIYSNTMWQMQRQKASTWISNRKNVGDFFDNFDHIMVHYIFEARSIYIADDTGLTTVHRPPNVVAEIGAMQVDQVTSAECVILITMNCTVNALGNAIPPFNIFQRVNFRDFIIKNVPPGSVGVAHKSGWMTSTNFEVWLNILSSIRPAPQKTKCSSCWTTIYPLTSRTKQSRI